MKKLIFCISALIFLPFLVNGQNAAVSNPELDYISSKEFPNNLTPKTDKVLRLDLDLYGNSRSAIFLSFSDFKDRSGNIWTVYTPTGGEYQRIDYTSNGDLIQFRPDGFYSFGLNQKYSKGGLYVLYPGRDGGEIVRYEFKDGVAKSEQLRAIDYNKKDDNNFAEAVLKHKLKATDPAESPAYKILSVSAIKSGGR